MKPNIKEVPFRSLALGARFCYLGSKKVWVKLSHDGTIAEWGEMATRNWGGQSVCSFSEDDDFDELVRLI